MLLFATTSLRSELVEDQWWVQDLTWGGRARARRFRPTGSASENGREGYIITKPKMTKLIYNLPSRPGG